MTSNKKYELIATGIELKHSDGVELKTEHLTDVTYEVETHRSDNAVKDVAALIAKDIIRGQLTVHDLLDKFLYLEITIEVSLDGQLKGIYQANRSLTALGYSSVCRI